MTVRRGTVGRCAEPAASISPTPKSMTTCGRRRGWLRVVVLTTSLLVAGVVSLVSGALVTTETHADALCDQMREQYGPAWPCISVPTYSPPPTQNTPPPSAGSAPGEAARGPGIAGSPGPGPGEGNGFPIVDVPDPPSGESRANREPSPNASVPQRGQIPAATSVDPSPEHSGATASTVPDVVVRDDTDVGLGAPTLQNVGDTEALLPAGGRGSDIPLPLWLLAGAAAIAVASPRTRLSGMRLLKPAGSTRGAVGPSRLVLIHDSASPRAYRFEMSVPNGGQTVINADGSATVVDQDGNAVREVARPWAFDSVGRPQHTWYTAEADGNLVQHVRPDDDAVYPILADPTETEYWDARLSAPPTGPYTPEQEQQRDTISQYEAEHGDPLTETRSSQAPLEFGDDALGSMLSPDAPPNATAEADGVSDAVGQANPLVGADQQQRSDQTEALGDLVAPWQAEPDNAPRGITTDGDQSTAGAEPAPGQSLDYDDWVRNNYLGEDVGVINQRTGPDGSLEYYRMEMAPDGTETEVTAASARVGENGDLLYVFSDGSVLNPDVNEGIWSLTKYDDSGVATTQFANGEQLELRPDGSGVRVLADGTRVEFRTGKDPDGTPALVDPTSGAVLDLPSVLGVLATSTIAAHGSFIEALATPGAVKGWQVPRTLGAGAVRWGGRAFGPAGAILGAEMDTGTGTPRTQAYVQNGAAWGAGVAAAGVAATIFGVAFAPATVIGLGVGAATYFLVKRAFS